MRGRGGRGSVHACSLAGRSSGETRRGEERGCSSVPADLCQRAGIKCVARGGEASRGMEEERRKS